MSEQPKPGELRDTMIKELNRLTGIFYPCHPCAGYWHLHTLKERRLIP